MPVTERVGKAKHIQTVSGVTPLAYWLSTWAWDLINMLFPTAFILVVFAAYQVDAYVSGTNMVLVMLLFLLFAWAVLPLVYVLSFLFATSSAAYARLCVLFVIGSMAMLLSVFLLSIPRCARSSCALRFKADPTAVLGCPPRRTR